MNKFILFDVGANRGEDSLDRTKNNPNVEAWAFEPMPEFANHLDRARKQGLGWRHLWEQQTPGDSYENRYHIVNSAVSDYNGRSTFYVADSDPNGDWGVSSLYPFADTVRQEWPGRNDLVTTRTIEVEVTRLDTWYQMQNLNLDKIDYFHCDTQGSDLRVLKGMGDLVYLIQEGVVECARDEKSKLYKENHTLEEMQDFLNDHGFQSTNVSSNDIWGNELNLYFRKK